MQHMYLKHWWLHYEQQQKHYLQEIQFISVTIGLLHLTKEIENMM